MPNDADALAALTAWVRMACPGTQVSEARGLRDGTALFELLQAVCVCATYAATMCISCSPARLRWTRCTKPFLHCTYAVADSSYADELHIPGHKLPSINVQAATKKTEQGTSELFKLVCLVLAIVLKSENNDEQVNAMQNLSLDEQVIMKQVVEEVLASHPTPDDATDGSAQAANDATCAEVSSLRRDLARANERVAEYQDQLAHAELQLERITAEHTEMLSQVAALREIEHERDALRDQLDEAKPLVDAHKKQERMLEKLRERVEETTDLKRQVKELEKQNAKLEEHACKAADHSAIDLAEKHRTASLKADRKHADLLEQHTQLKRAHEALQAQYDRVCDERRQDQSQMQGLLERVRTLEEEGSHDDLDASFTLADDQGEDEKPHYDSNDAPTDSADVGTMMSGIMADITALRNNATSKRAEAESLLRKLEKKVPKEAGKSSSKDIKIVCNLFADSFRHEDLVMQRLQRCWDHVHTVRHLRMPLTLSAHAPS